MEKQEAELAPFFAVHQASTRLIHEILVKGLPTPIVPVGKGAKCVQLGIGKRN